MGPQSHRRPNFGNFGTPKWESRTNCHLDLGLVERHIVYYMGESGGFSHVQAVESLVSASLPVVHPSTKSAPIMH
jgi:hypothetical protein